MSLYPEETLSLLEKKDILLIGFENLSVKVVKVLKDKILLKVITSGFFRG